MSNFIKEKKILMLLKSNISNDARVIKEANLLNYNNYRVHLIFKIRKTENFKKDFIFNLIPISYPLVNKTVVFKIFNHYVTSMKFIIAGITLKPYAVHSHDHNTLFEGVIISLFTHAKLVYDSHELWYERIPTIINGKNNIKRIFAKRLEKFLEKILCLRVNYIITVADSIKKIISDNLLVKKDITIVRNFHSTKDIHNFSLNIYHKLFPNTLNKKILLYRGNLDMANFDYEALGSLDKLKNSVIVILGNSTDEEKNFINKFIGGEKEKIIFIPQVTFKEMLEFIYFADIGLYIKKNVCDNIYYSLPNKIFEYLAFGKPIISTNLFEIEKMVNQYNIGEIYNQGEKYSFLRAVNKLLDEDYYKIVQTNVKKSFESYLNWEKESENLLEVYRSFN